MECGVWKACFVPPYHEHTAWCVGRTTWLTSTCHLRCLWTIKDFGMKAFFTPFVRCIVMETQHFFSLRFAFLFHQWRCQEGKASASLSPSSYIFLSLEVLYSLITCLFSLFPSFFSLYFSIFSPQCCAADEVFCHCPVTILMRDTVRQLLLYKTKTPGAGHVVRDGYITTWQTNYLAWGQSSGGRTSPRPLPRC